MATQQTKLSKPKWSFPLLPKKGKLRASDKEKAYTIEPLDKLPGFLLPSASRKSDRRPPTLHLGWIVDDKVLIRLCKERGIGPLSPEDLREYLKDEYDESEDEDYDDVPREPNYYT